MSSTNHFNFINANLEPVPYDGSEVTWRISAYVLITKDAQLLLAKSRLEKFYDVLGGGIDIGETIEEALHREALEEGGAYINIGKLLFVAQDWFYHRKGNFHQTLQLYYEAEVIGELDQPTDPDIEDWLRPLS
jgi:8-oxo-dGTP pyrophosphatase MutT (NUDIX family)